MEVHWTDYAQREDFRRGRCRRWIASFAAMDPRTSTSDAGEDGFDASEEGLLVRP